MLLLLLGLSAVANGQGQGNPGEPFSDTTRVGTPGYANWRTDANRMEVGIGMFMPIGSDLGSLGTEGQEKRDALMVAAYMINNDPQYNVRLTYDYTTTLLDTGLDASFADKGVSQGDSMGTGGTFTDPDDFASKNQGSDLCTRARQLCDNAQVKAIVGGYRSSRSIGMAHCCMSKDGLPHVSPGSTSAYLTKNRPYPGGTDASIPRDTAGGYFPYFFRSVPNDDYQGVALMEMAKAQGFTDVSVIYTDDAYSRGMAEAFIASWTDQGLTVNPAGGINMGLVDQGDVISGAFGKTNAQLAAERQLNEGTSSVTILTTVSHDTDALMEAFGNLGMTGDGWVFLGADGATSTDYGTGHLADQYLGMAGTTALLPTETTLYTEFVYAWTNMANSKGDPTGPDKIPNEAKNIQPGDLPWAGKNNNMVGAFTAQTYDAVAAIATAATNWLQTMEICNGVDNGQCCDTDPQYQSTPQCATLFTREEMRKSLEDGVEFRALSGQDACSPALDTTQSNTCLRLFKKDATDSSKGQDGASMYSVVNAQGDSWAVLGTWTSGVPLTLDHPIEWPGGKTSAPTQDRPAVGGLSQGGSGDDMPSWIVPMVVILVIVVLGLALCMCYIIKREKQGMPVFDSPGAEA